MFLSSSLSLRYAAASHSVHALLLAPRPSHALTYSRLALSSSSLFSSCYISRRSRVLSEPPFSASPVAKPVALRVLLQKNTFRCEYMCQEAGFARGAALSLPSPICHSTSIFCLISSRGLHSQMWRTFLLALSLNSPQPTAPPPFNLLPPTHTDPWSLGLFSNILQVNQKWKLLLLVKPSPELQIT